MTLFLSLLPIYLLGNLHCMGMCGPLVVLLAKNRYRWWYFGGRLAGFALAGLVSAEMGLVLFTFLQRYRLSALFSILFGLWITLMGFSLIFKLRLPGTVWLEKKISKFAQPFAQLALQNRSFPIFLFGLSTLLLPCGQSLIVFSTLALHASPLEGLLNGALFALLTSPALVSALLTSQFFLKRKNQYPFFIGSTAFIIGTLAILRGCAELDWVPHLILNPTAPSQYHIVFF